MFTGISEILLILGMAALIKWELDLPALAGIIASVGTGVNHQIVITDENLKRTKQRKLVSIAERMRRAFTIIFTAAATVIAAMIPLLGIGAGLLKGFAFTTIMGVFIGVGITRPAFAKIIEYILKQEE
jgi:preprotein translocase subunit SecD